MSREIKFRAWDKTKKLLMPVKLIDFSEWWVSCNPIGVNELLEFGERNSFKNEETDRHILMQYTGVNDMNNVEIYEGDIVKGYLLIQDCKFLSKVIFEDGLFKLKFDKQCGNIIYEDLTYYNAIKLEVIGNIYENPDLLEVTP